MKTATVAHTGVFLVVAFLFCFVLLLFSFFLNFFLFFFNLKEQVLLELLGLLKGRLVTRHSVFKSVLQQDYLEGDRIY